MAWSLSSKVELYVKIVVKNFTLFGENEMDSISFMLIKHWRFASVENLVGDIPELLRSKLFAFDIGIDCLCIATLCISLDLSCNVCRQFWIQRLSCYTVLCYRYCTSGYGELWLQHIQDWTKPAFSIFAGIFFCAKKKTTLHSRKNPFQDEGGRVGWRGSMIKVG